MPYTYASYQDAFSCVYTWKILEKKLIYSDPSCFTIEQFVLDNSNITPYYVSVYNSTCLNEKLNLWPSIESQDLWNIISSHLPQNWEITNFIIKDIFLAWVYGEKYFNTGSLIIEKSKIIDIDGKIIVNIQESYSGNLLACEDLWVEIPIISDESNIIPLEYNSTHPSEWWNNIFIWILFLWVISIFFFFWIKKLRKKK